MLPDEPNGVPDELNGLPDETNGLPEGFDPKNAIVKSCVACLDYRCLFYVRVDFRANHCCQPPTIRIQNFHLLQTRNDLRLVTPKSERNGPVRPGCLEIEPA